MTSVSFMIIARICKQPKFCSFCKICLFKFHLCGLHGFVREFSSPFSISYLTLAPGRQGVPPLEPAGCSMWLRLWVGTSTGPDKVQGQDGGARGAQGTEEWGPQRGVAGILREADLARSQEFLGGRTRALRRENLCVQCKRPLVPESSVRNLAHATYQANPNPVEALPASTRLEVIVQCHLPQGHSHLRSGSGPYAMQWLDHPSP